MNTDSFSLIKRERLSLRHSGRNAAMLIRAHHISGASFWTASVLRNTFRLDKDGNYFICRNRRAKYELSDASAARYAEHGSPVFRCDVCTTKV
jgi:DNA-binding transcriptional regulator PaaX